MARVNVGDVVRLRTQWGRLPTSVRYQCPVCRLFIARGATACSCGVRFDYVSADYGQVTSLASP